MQKFRQTGESWRIYGLTYPTFVFSSASSFLVLLIVLLRYLAIKNPMSFESSHIKYGKIGSAMIFSFCFIVPSITFVLTAPSIYDQKLYTVFNMIVFHIIYTIPITGTLIMYGMLIYALRNKKHVAETTAMRLKSMANMSQGIVIGLVVCNVPLILWTQVYLVKMMQCKKEEFINSAFGVKVFVK